MCGSYYIFAGGIVKKEKRVGPRWGEREGSRPDERRKIKGEAPTTSQPL